MSVNYFKIMHHELKHSKNRVILVDAEEPKHSCHRIRLRVETPPQWYLDFIHQFPSKRHLHGKRKKFDSKIKRANILRLLNRMDKTSSKYKQNLIHIANQMLEEDEKEIIPF